MTETNYRLPEWLRVANGLRGIDLGHGVLLESSVVVECREMPSGVAYLPGFRLDEVGSDHEAVLAKLERPDRSTLGGRKSAKQVFEEVQNSVAKTLVSKSDEYLEGFYAAWKEVQKLVEHLEQKA